MSRKKFFPSPLGGETDVVTVHLWLVFATIQRWTSFTVRKRMLLLKWDRAFERDGNERACLIWSRSEGALGKKGPQWSPQNRPFVDGSKPAIRLYSGRWFWCSPFLLVSLVFVGVATFTRKFGKGRKRPAGGPAKGRKTREAIVERAMHVAASEGLAVVYCQLIGRESK